MKTIGLPCAAPSAPLKRLWADGSPFPFLRHFAPDVQNAYTTDTRFGKAQDWVRRVEAIAGRPVLHTIVQAEPIGPKGLVDLLAVAPCTGNTLSKIAAGITDTPVTMAVKSALRIGIPVVLCCATNDAMAASGPNLLRLLNTKTSTWCPCARMTR